MATKKKSTTAKRNTQKSKNNSVAAKPKTVATSDTSKKADVKESSIKPTETVSSARSTVKVSKGSSTISNLSKKDAALKKLNGWNWIFALVYTAQAVALAVYADDAFRGLTSSFQTEDVIAGTDYAVYAQATRHLMDLNVMYLLAAILGVSALMHLLAGTVFRKKYETDLGRERNGLRWLGAGVGSALILTTSGVLAGISDIALLLGLMVLTGFAMTATVTDTSEKMATYMAYARRSTVMQVLSTILWLAPWTIVGLYLVGAEKYGSGVEPYVYALFATAFFGLTMQMMYLSRKMTKRGNGEVDYANVDWTHAVLSLVVSSAFVWQIYFAIMG